MTTKTGKFTATIITALFLLALLTAGAKVIHASAAQAELMDDRAKSVKTAAQEAVRGNSQVEFYGKIQAISGVTWTISGQTVTVNPGAEIKGSLVVGDLVKVHAFRSADGALIAREIAASLGAFSQDGSANSNQAIADQPGNSNANLNGDDNGNGSVDDNANLNSNDDNGNDSDDGNTNMNDDDDNGNGVDEGNENEDHDDDDHGNVNTNGNDHEDEPGGGHGHDG